LELLGIAALRLDRKPKTCKVFMMKKRIIKCFPVFVIAACALLSTCAYGARAERNLSRDMLMALVWQQSSGEYEALCRQAFNAGKAYLISLEEKTPAGTGLRRAVVLDIDETVLDNSPFEGLLVKEGRLFGGQTWDAWCAAAEAAAVPGSLEFTLFAAGRGIEVFYVSNRSVSVFEGTRANLQKLGFPYADSSHILLKDGVSDKGPRLESIRSGGYEIVLLAGDNLDDLDASLRGLGNPQRKAWVGENRESFGGRRIVLPNAAYGSFEEAIVKGYYGLSSEERAEARLKILRVWENGE
jgi:5'-nucleotidase (lipoprotein e(P4) family)